MKIEPPDRLPRNQLLISAGFSLFASGIILWITHRIGAGLTPDSVEYLAVARNVILGNGLVQHNGTPLIVWPPFYPLLLALTGKVLTVDPLALAPIVNALIFGLIIFFGARLLFKELRLSPAFAAVGLVALLVSPQLLSVTVMAWSEALFILAVMAGFFFSFAYMKSGDLSSLLGLSAAAASAGLIRYSGVALILTGGIVILLAGQGGRRTRAAHLLLFLAIASVPLGIWLLRNYALSGTLTGARGSSLFTMRQVLTQLWSRLATWYVPSAVVDRRLLLIAASGLFGFLLGLFPRRLWQILKRRFWEARPLVVFTASYGLLTVLSCTFTSLEPLSNRYLSPLSMPLTLLLMMLAHDYLKLFGEQFLELKLQRWVVIGLVGWLIYPAFRASLEARFFVDAGRPLDSHQGWVYTSRDWKESATIDYLLENRSLEAECVIYSNEPYAAYILANLVVKESPTKTPYIAQQVVRDISEFAGWWPVDNQACLIWFDLHPRHELFTLDELGMIVDLIVIDHFEDGALYAIGQK